MPKIEYVPTFNFNRSDHRRVANMVGTEFSNLSQACYKGSFTKYYQDLRRIFNVNDRDIKEFKQTNISRKYHSFWLFNSSDTLLFIMAILYFSRKDMDDTAKLFFDFLALKIQGSRMHTHFPKYCNNDIFSMTTDRLSHRHLYRVKRGISNAVAYMSDEEYRKAKRYLSDPNLDDDKLVKIANSLRTRLAQSLRSFAVVYYSLSDEVGAQVSDEVPLSGIQMVAEKVSQQICTYQNIDKSALGQAINKSGIRKEIGLNIITEMSQGSNKDRVKFLIILMDRLVPIKDICNESKRLALLRKIDKKQRVGKYIVRDEFISALKALPNSYKFTSVHETQQVMFLANYLTIYLKNRIC